MLLSKLKRRNQLQLKRKMTLNLAIRTPLAFIVVKLPMQPMLSYIILHLMRVKMTMRKLSEELQLDM